MRNLMILSFFSFILFACAEKKSVQFENSIKEVYSKHFISTEQNDVNQEKSFREKNISHEQYEKLIETILKRVYNKELNIFSSIDETTKLSPEEIDNILYTSEIIEIEDADGFETNKTVESKLEAEHITHIEFKENWNYSTNGAIQKTVQRVGLYKQSFDQTGEVKGLVLIFWVEL